jgi:hypothetical protein
VRGSFDARLFVVSHSTSGKCDHVEEKFMDVLERAKHKDCAVVAGKMRPCATCFGRMSWMNTLGYSVEHGQHPGFLWFGRLEEQEQKIRDFTLAKYKVAGSHKTKTGSYFYGSDSDSDGEDELL